MRNILICLGSLIIIVLSFAIPNILFEIEDMQNNKKEYSTSKTESKIDVKAQNIYLVKLIHEIQKGYLNLAVNNMYSVVSKEEEDKTNRQDKVLQNLKTEIKRMNDIRIIGENFVNTNQSILQYEGQERTYSDKTNKYVINQISLKLNNGQRILAEIEEKTGKILLYSSEIKEIENFEEEEILRNFVKYLDLYIIADWKYENNMLISEEAKLAAILACYDDRVYLSVQSID